MPPAGQLHRRLRGRQGETTWVVGVRPPRRPAGRQGMTDLGSGWQSRDRGRLLTGEGIKEYLEALCLTNLNRLKVSKMRERATARSEGIKGV